jgi:hypothetical protein
MKIQFTQALNRYLSMALLFIQALNAADILNAMGFVQEHVPLKYKAGIASLAGAVQFYVSWKAHRVNPDGTPATVAFRPADPDRTPQG